MIETRFLRTSSIILLTPAGQRNQANLCTPRLSTQRLGNFVTAQIRHPNIEKRYVRAEHLRERESGPAIVGHAHFVSR